MATFAERGIRFMPNRRVSAVDVQRRVAHARRRQRAGLGPVSGCSEAPRAGRGAGGRHDGRRRLGAGEPTYAEDPPPQCLCRRRHRQHRYTEGRRVCRGRGPGGGQRADRARIRGAGEAAPYAAAGTCYIEFGGGRIGRVDVDFFSGTKPTGTYHEPDVALARAQGALRGEPQGRIGSASEFPGRPPHWARQAGSNRTSGLEVREGQQWVRSAPF